MGRPRIYTDEERKQRKKEYNAKYRAENPEYQAEYYQENREKKLEYQAKYVANHKEKIAEYKAEYYKTQMGRASNLVTNYQRSDKKQNRGECTLTAKWVVENIFTMPCHYCGKEGWDVIGCDRIDNSLPHTPENVVPCCAECNKKRRLKTYEEFKNEKDKL